MRAEARGVYVPANRPGCSGRRALRRRHAVPRSCSDGELRDEATRRGHGRGAAGADAPTPTCRAVVSTAAAPRRAVRDARCGLGGADADRKTVLRPAWRDRAYQAAWTANAPTPGLSSSIRDGREYAAPVGRRAADGHVHDRTGARELRIALGVAMGRPSEIECAMADGRVRVGQRVVLAVGEIAIYSAARIDRGSSARAETGRHTVRHSGNRQPRTGDRGAPPMSRGAPRIPSSTCPLRPAASTTARCESFAARAGARPASRGGLTSRNCRRMLVPR